MGRCVIFVRTNIKLIWMMTNEDKMKEIAQVIQGVVDERKLSMYRLRTYVGKGSGSGLGSVDTVNHILGRGEGDYMMGSFLKLLRGLGKSIVIVDDLGAPLRVGLSAVSPAHAGREDAATIPCANETKKQTKP